MKRLIMLAAFAAACGTQTTQVQTESLDVYYGESVKIPGDTTTVKFTDVTADSRCPANVQCVWAGEATIALTVGGTQHVSLTLGADASKATARAGGGQMTFTALKPAPVANSTINKADYVATLKFSR